MLRRIAFLIALLVGLVAIRAEASSNPFPASVAAGESTLAQRGAHLFTWYGFEVYWGALYVEPAVADADVLNADVARQLSLHYQRRISAANIRKATQKSIEKNPALDIAKLQPRFDKLYGYYRDVKKGDQYDIAYDPAKGTTITFNGTELGTIEGADFAEAFFGIWLSDHPIDDDMRAALRGIEE